MTVTRAGVLAAFLVAAPMALHAETITVYHAAPDQAALKMGTFQSPVAGAKALELDVGIGSGAFRDPKDAPNQFYTVSDRGPNFTCDDAEDLMGVKADDDLPRGRRPEGRQRAPLPDAGFHHHHLSCGARPGGEDLHGHRFAAAEDAEGQSGHRPHQPAQGRQDRQAARRRRPAAEAGSERARRRGLRAPCRRPLLHRRRERHRHRRDFAGRRVGAPLRAGRHRAGFRRSGLSRGRQPARDPRQAALQPRHRIADHVGRWRLPLRDGPEPAR